MRNLPLILQKVIKSCIYVSQLTQGKINLSDVKQGGPSFLVGPSCEWGGGHSPIASMDSIPVHHRIRFTTPVDRITDTTENITFPRTTLRER